MSRSFFVRVCMFTEIAEIVNMFIKRLQQPHLAFRTIENAHILNNTDDRQINLLTEYEFLAYVNQ